MYITSQDFITSPIASAECIDAAKWHMLNHAKDIKNSCIFVAVNMRIESFRHRLFVVETKTKKILGAYHTSHGSKSSMPNYPEKARSFSNIVGSRQTSSGAMVTGAIYSGIHGKSLRLEGLEPGINDCVGIRSVVIHPAKYMTPEFIRANCRAGQSWGCLALDPAISSAVIDQIQEGVFLYVYV
jgi:hypothetical protein